MMMLTLVELPLWAELIEIGRKARAFVSTSVEPTPARRRASGMVPCPGYHHHGTKSPTYTVQTHGAKRPGAGASHRGILGKRRTHNLWAGVPMEAGGGGRQRVAQTYLEGAPHRGGGDQSPDGAGRRIAQWRDRIDRWGAFGRTAMPRWLGAAGRRGKAVSIECGVNRVGVFYPTAP